MSEKVDNEIKCGGAVILAGGDSKRLGQPKALLEFGGQTLVQLIINQLNQCFNEIALITDKAELYSDLQVRIFSDVLKGKEKSPLRGIHAGLTISNRPWQFFVACDMPFLNLNLITYMSGFAADYDAVVPRIGDYFQPLHAFYSRSCIVDIEKHISNSQFKVTDFYKDLRIKYIGREEINRFAPGEETFLNINTWDDYQKALDLMSGRTSTG